MTQQATNSVLMIRPVQFRMNEQTAVNNYYQNVIESLTPEQVNALAVKEFDGFVNQLRHAGVQVVVVEDTKDFDTPDSIFPNNWVSFHGDGTVGLFPMFAKNRRQERKDSILDTIEAQGFDIETIVDYTTAEQENLFLEGTGSLILDRKNRKAYCALSPRADEDLLIEFCEDFEYTPVVFSAFQTVGNLRKKIYHTNVMMCVGDTFAVVCLDSIDDKKERQNVVKHLKRDGKSIVHITESQVNQFAGNMLQLRGTNDQSLLVMSQSARDSLTAVQLHELELHAQIISVSLDTIETCGGGSARCMMAEIFLPKRLNN